ISSCNLQTTVRHHEVITVVLTCLASLAVGQSNVNACIAACPQNIAIVCGRVGKTISAYRNRCYLPCFHATFVANWPCKVTNDADVNSVTLSGENSGAVNTNQ
ncbi:unnamed protein product, partial [Leptidea sinapis]